MSAVDYKQISLTSIVASILKVQTYPKIFTSTLQGHMSGVNHQFQEYG